MRKVRNLSLVLTNNEVKKLLTGTPEEHSQVIQELEEKLSALVKDVSSTEPIVSLTISNNDPITFFKRIISRIKASNNAKKQLKKGKKKNGKRKNKRRS